MRGIIDAGSLVCQRIAAHFTFFSTAKDGAQRVIRFAKGKSTKRSAVDADHLVDLLCQRGVEQLAQSDTDELWLMVDASDLRKPYASEMPDLMQVKDLDGSLVPGYRTLNVLGVTPGRRGILYHRLFSSTSEDFVSEPLEVQRGLTKVSQAVRPLKERMTINWIMDRGLDDVAVWRTIWEQDEHLVCRVKHTERLVEYQAADGTWRERDVAAAGQHLRPMARARAEMVVRLGRQTKEKRQEVTAKIGVCPLRLSYDTAVRREGEGETVRKDLWLVQVEVVRSHMKPWWLITDWPVEDAEDALRIFRMYRQRWSVEESFKFTKECLGWEEVQLLDLGGDSHPGGSGLGGGRLPLRVGSDVPVGRGATVGPLGRMGGAQGQSPREDCVDMRFASCGGHADHPSLSGSISQGAWGLAPSYRQMDRRTAPS